MQTSQAPEFGGAKTDVAGTIVSMLEVAEYAPGAPRGCLHRFWWVEPDDAFFTRLEVTPVRRCPSLTLGYLELRNLGFQDQPSKKRYRTWSCPKVASTLKR